MTIEEYNEEKALIREQLLYELEELERGQPYYKNIDDYIKDFPEVEKEWHPDYIQGLRNSPTFLIKAHPVHSYSTIPGHYLFVGLVSWGQKEHKVYINDGDDGYIERYFTDRAEAKQLHEDLRDCWLWSDYNLKMCFKLKNG